MVLVVVVLVGCGQRKGETREGGRFVLQRYNIDTYNFETYGVIEGREGKEALGEWIEANREELEAGDIAPHLAMLPGDQLCWTDDKRDVVYYLLRRLPVDFSVPRASRTYKENLSEEALEELRSLFSRYGTRVAPRVRQGGYGE